VSDLESEIKKSPACLAVSSVLGRLRLAAIFSLVLNCLFGGLALGGIALLVAVAGYYANYWWLIFSVGLILGVLITLILNLKFWSFPDIASAGRYVDRTLGLKGIGMTIADSGTGQSGYCQEFLSQANCLTRDIAACPVSVWPKFGSYILLPVFFVAIEMATLFLSVGDGGYSGVASDNSGQNFITLIDVDSIKDLTDKAKKKIDVPQDNILLSTFLSGKGQPSKTARESDGVGDSEIKGRNGAVSGGGGILDVIADSAVNTEFSRIDLSDMVVAVPPRYREVVRKYFQLINDRQGLAGGEGR